MKFVVIPSFNEAPNLKTLLPEILELHEIDHVIVVDDGSDDDTHQVIQDINQNSDRKISITGSKKRRGKAVALRKGFELAMEKGADVVVMMDGDGQDRPEEIPKLLEMIENGKVDLVTGARTKRNDRITKRYVSKFYNWTTAKLTKTPSRDMNSGLKAMTSDVASDLIGYLYGDLHRYITVIAHWQGYKVKDVTVDHHSRMSGKSKYGPQRFWRGFIDLMTVRFLLGFNTRPNHFFGAPAMVSLLIGAGLITWMGVEWIAGNSIGTRPALLAGVFFTLSGFQFLTFGLLAEMFSNHSVGTKRIG